MERGKDEDASFYVFGNKTQNVQHYIFILLTFTIILSTNGPVIMFRQKAAAHT